MGKVTYLLGAGASFNSLPLVKDIPSAIDKLRQDIVHLVIDPTVYFSDINTHTISEGREWFKIECEKLKKMVQVQSSIDTYAKKLSITKERRDLQALKVILSCLFIYLQFENPGDYRYDAFFASILGKDSCDFNNDIRIVSWNYDYQLEKAYGRYSLHNEIRKNQDLLHVYPGSRKFEDYQDRFSIFKMNGTTSFINNVSQGKNEDIVRTLDFSDKDGLLKVCIWYYILAVLRMDENLVTPMLSFAWESFPVLGISNIINKAQEAIAKSDAIVVIGYSFPFFNRTIDKILISSACKEDKTKIYVQDIKPSNIIDKLASVLPKDYPRSNLMPIDAYISKDPNAAKDQFFLPPEL